MISVKQRIVFLLVPLLLVGMSGSLIQARADSPSTDTTNSAPQGASEPEDPAQAELKRSLKTAHDEASELYYQNRFDDAIPLSKKAIELAEQLNPAEPETVAQELINFATILQAKGALRETRPTLERALKLVEQAKGKDSPEVAACLLKLGLLIKAQLDYDSAEPHYRRALAILEKAPDSESAVLAEVLKSLANLVDARNDFASGLEMNKRVQQIYEKKAAQISEEETKPALEDPQEEAGRQTKIAKERKDIELLIADNYNDQSTELYELNKAEESQKLLEQAISLRKKHLPANDPEVLECINNLAMLHLANDQPEKTQSLMKDALEQSRKSMKEDPNLAGFLNNLAEASAQLGDHDTAERYALESAQITDAHVRKVLPNLSFAEQRKFLDQSLPGQITLLMRVCKKGESLKNAYALYFRWKGLLIESLRSASKIQGLAANPALAPKLARLQKLRSEISVWFLQSKAVDAEQWKKHNDELTDEKEILERELSNSLDNGVLSDSLVSRSISDVWASMKTGECLVDIYTYPYETTDVTSGLWRYAAIVSGPGVSPVLVDIGRADQLGESMAAWQKSVLKGETATEPWKVLCDSVWKPIAASLPANTKKIWVCPDGEMFRLPWHLFGESAPGTATSVISQADSVRELVNLWSRQNPSSSKLLAVGGIDFNASSDDKSQRSLITVPALPGTLKEVKDIEAIAQTCKIPFEEITGSAATKTAVSKAMEAYSYIHLATHGIFVTNDIMQLVRRAHRSEEADKAEKGKDGSSNSDKGAQKDTSAPPPTSTSAPTPTAAPTSTAAPTPAPASPPPANGSRSVRTPEGATKSGGSGTSLPPITRAIKVLPQYLRDRNSSRNPLVESALAFAGANRDSGATGMSGFMTAEELLGLNLAGCKHLSLSACETARGREVTGQGVMGLRAAIMSAGVNSVLMSLWKVPDTETVELMKAFYRNLWEKKLPASQALLQAQKELRKKPGSIPINWAAWIVVGE